LAAKERIATKWMEIDQDYLRTKIAIALEHLMSISSDFLFWKNLGWF